MVGEGGHPRQFKCGIERAEGRQSRSAFSDSFDDSDVKVRKMGRYEVEIIDVPVEPSTFGEMHWLLHHSKQGTGFFAIYDVEAFSEAEAREIISETLKEMVDMA